jgi:uncharacterized protein YggL (DUF469 family)
MSDAAELVSELKVGLAAGLERGKAKRVYDALEDELLIPRGLYLDGGLSYAGSAAEIAGVLTRADGTGLTARDVQFVEAWLGARPEVAGFSLGPLKPA